MAVQWLRHYLPMQRAWVQSLVRELRSHVPWDVVRIFKKGGIQPRRACGKKCSQPRLRGAKDAAREKL